MLSKYAQMYTWWFKYRINIKHPCWCSEDQDNLRYALITFMLHYTPHSDDKVLTQVIWVLRKPTRVFLLLSKSNDDVTRSPTWERIINLRFSFDWMVGEMII